MSAGTADIRRDLDALGRAAREIAGSLNDLATATIGYGDMLMARHGRDERDRADLHEIQTAGRRVAMLAQQLRAFTCDGPVRVAEVDLNLVLAAVERRLRGFLPDGMSLTSDVSEGPLAVSVDPEQVEQALLNLVLNAQKAFVRGTVHMDVVLRPASPGVPAAVVGRIAASGTEARDGGGASLPDEASLNLSAACAVLSRNGGRLSVDRTTSALVFSVSLPPSRSEPVFAGTPLVLVVDQDDAVRRLAAGLLREHHLRVLEAATAWSARRLFESHPRIALVIVGTAVCGESGLALVREFTAVRPRLRTMLLAAHGTAQLSIGPDDVCAVIDKPFRPSTMLRAVGLALTARETQDPLPAAASRTF